MKVVAEILISATAAAEDSYTQRSAPFVMAGVIFFIGCVVGPIVFSASNPFTDPKNFLTFGIANSQFVPGVVLGGILAPTGIGTFVLLSAGSIIWGGNFAAIVAGLLAAVIGTAM